MALTVGVPKETADGETRVALVPEVVRRLTAADVTVVVEEGAGAGAHHPDADYEGAGAEIVERNEVLGADVVTVVSLPPDTEIEQLGGDQVVVGLLDPLGDAEKIKTLAETDVTALAMELVPRISRAQKMDALSAMSSLAGYRATLIGAHALPKFFPLLTTAAGTIRPAQVLVLGAGVAGLQAIATAKRLGARVQGYDIREATREEVESLGAQFVELELGAEGEGEGGYAKKLEQEIQERQPELLLPHVAEADVVVSTALIPGAEAPLLISEEAVQAMGPGSVVVDLAAPGGGNCALTQAGETVRVHDVQVFGPTNLPADMPVHASYLYARTVAELVQEFIDGEGQFVPDFDDDIFAGTCVTHAGTVRNDRIRKALGMEARERKEVGEKEKEQAPNEEVKEESTTEGEERASRDESFAEKPPASDASFASAEKSAREPTAEEERVEAEAEETVEEEGEEDEEWKPPRP